jgi:PIN domain nuclease of toxin-antitoxin system
VKLLLDTQYLVWLALAPERVHPLELQAIEESRSDVLVSSVSIWEMRLKWGKRHRSGARKGALDPEIAVRIVEKSGFTLVGLSAAQAAATLATPTSHGDPFDEQLLIQAQELRARLLTRDELLAVHPLALRLV